MADVSTHALAMHRHDRWMLEVHNVDDDALLASSTLLLSGVELPPEKLLDMLLNAKDLERVGDWVPRPDEVWVAPVRPTAH
jgi:hypothetical protein